MKTRLNKGFTLIELLVVIAIIGILSGIVLTSLNGARKKAQIAAAQATIKGIQPGAVICLDDGLDLSDPVIGDPLCSGSDSLWPTLPQGWTYDATITSDPDAATFSFSARSTSADKVISCTNSDCATVTDIP